VSSCRHLQPESKETVINPASSSNLFLSLDEIADRIETVLQRSTADETEIVWLETQGGSAENHNRQVETRGHRERTILVRVIDHRRVGSHRTGSATVGELDAAVRSAVAQSRSREPLPGMLHLPVDDSPLTPLENLWDPRIAELDADRVRSMYEPWLGQRGVIHLEWKTCRICVFNSRGVRRRTQVTAASVQARVGRRPGGGRAGGAARTLAALQPQAVVERARQRHATGPVGELPDGPRQVVFSPEATGQICDILNRVALSAIAYYHGSSFLREHLDDQVFDRGFNLRDDGTDTTGLAFPFDLEGTAKRPVDMISKGTPKTPAVDQRQAAQLGLSATAHAIGGNDARAMNLFMLPGESDDRQMLQTADDGIWIGWLDQVECYEPGRVQIRGRALGVRRITEGRLGEGLPDLIWEDSLLRALSNLTAVGSTTVVRVSHDGFLGGISAPSVAIDGAGSLRLADT
jgi:predicted Zn-dependent protease